MDAATPPSSVALVRGARVLEERKGPFGPRTDAWLHQAVADMLGEHGADLQELDVIAAGSGPGTFTGIRVALATALGLSAGSGVPVCGVGTLDALVAGALAATDDAGPHDVLALIDARRGQHYAQLVRAAALAPLPWRPVWGPEALDAAGLEARLASRRPDLIAGVSTPAVADIPHVAGPSLAAAIALLAAVTPGPQRPPAEPHYLRPPDATPGVSPLRRRRL